METIGYAASLLIGISLGMIGGGGSILTVPVMVYFFGLQPLIATSYSLFVVGSTSLIGAFSNFRRGLVNVKAAMVFGASSIITVFVTRKFLVMLIPKDIFKIGGVTINEAFLTMVLFALLMLVASISMIRNKRITATEEECSDRVRFGKLTGYGIVIGLVTGLLGAGGGFLLIPALVVLMKLPMKKAIGTSLMIIAFNSLIGFTGDLGHFPIDWLFLLKVTAVAVVGIFIGGAITRKISGENLKKGFGWFVMVMGVYIIFNEMILKRPS